MKAETTDYDTLQWLIRRSAQDYHFYREQQAKHTIEKADESRPDFSRGMSAGLSIAYGIAGDNIKRLLSVLDVHILDTTPEMIAEAEKEVYHA